jgi:hypothetical protein
VNLLISRQSRLSELLPLCANDFLLSGSHLFPSPRTHLSPLALSIHLWKCNCTGTLADPLYFLSWVLWELFLGNLYRRVLFLLCRNHLRRTVLFSAVLSALLVSIWVLDRRHSAASASLERAKAEWADLNENADTTPISAYSDPAYQPEVSRLIYPYSVIPGGVTNSEELRAVSAHDPVVREHYAQFDFRKARVVRLRRAQLVYLSYRIGDKIYWTTKKVTLHKGEKLITDGKMTARTRCANRVSALPQKKAFPQEPAVTLFDKPIDSSMRIPLPENFRSALESRPGLPGWGPAPLGPVGPGGLVASSPSPLGGGYLPVGSPLAPGSRCSKSGVCNTGPPGPGPPSVPVPEPGTVELICAEILAMTLGWRFVSKRRD